MYPLTGGTGLQRTAGVLPGTAVIASENPSLVSVVVCHLTSPMLWWKPARRRNRRAAS